MNTLVAVIGIATSLVLFVAVVLWIWLQWREWRYTRRQR